MKDEYISRQAAFDALGVTKNATKYGGDHSGYDTMMLYEIHDALTGVPAADVVSVRLGEWLDGYKMQTCSLCKCRGKKSWTFCPHCGARMIYGKRREE